MLQSSESVEIALQSHLAERAEGKSHNDFHEYVILLFVI